MHNPFCNYVTEFQIMQSVINTKCRAVFNAYPWCHGPLHHFALIMSHCSSLASYDQGCCWTPEALLISPTHTQVTVSPGIDTLELSLSNDRGADINNVSAHFLRQQQSLLINEQTRLLITIWKEKLDSYSKHNRQQLVRELMWRILTRIPVFENISWLIV